MALGVLAALAMMAAAPVESAIEAPGPQGPLRGTLMSAQASGPVVLILPGSGPTDRDGNNTLGVKAATYRLLAEGLAAHGINSVRIDKRGLFASAAAVPDANAVTMEDYAADTAAWVQAVHGRTGARCVWLAGHSEGGLVALAAAAHDAKGLCGLLLIATPGRPLGEVLRGQLQANPANAPILSSAMAAIDTLEKGERVNTATLPPPLAGLFRPQVQGFLVSSFRLDPAKLVAGLTLPVLIMQGERDLQVKVEDARRLAAAQPRARLVLLPDMNHVLKQVPSTERGANLATYADPFLPLAPGVVEAVAGFVEAGR